MTLFEITSANASSQAKLFLILAIAWYVMAFASRGKRTAHAAVYGTLGTAFLIFGLYAGWKALTSAEFALSKLAVPIILAVVAAAALIFGIARFAGDAGNADEPDLPEGMDEYMFSEEDFQALEDKAGKPEK